MHWHATDANAVMRELDSTAEGLTSADARQRLQRVGPNTLPRPRAVSAWRILWNQVRSVIVLLLLAAAEVAWVSGDVLDAAAIVAVLVFLGAGLLGWAAPLTPLQILWLNIVTDTFPALALAFEPAERDLMRRPPRNPRARILSARMVRCTAAYGLLIAASALSAFWWAMQSSSASPSHTRTVTFMALALAQLFHLGTARVVAPARIVANRVALGAVALVLGLQIIAVSWAPLTRVLGATALSPTYWVVAGAPGIIPFLVGRLVMAQHERYAVVVQAGMTSGRILNP